MAFTQSTLKKLYNHFVARERRRDVTMQKFARFNVMANQNRDNYEQYVYDSDKSTDDMAVWQCYESVVICLKSEAYLSELDGVLALFNDDARKSSKWSNSLSAFDKIVSATDPNKLIYLTGYSSAANLCMFIHTSRMHAHPKLHTIVFNPLKEQQTVKQIPILRILFEIAKNGRNDGLKMYYTKGNHLTSVNRILPSGKPLIVKPTTKWGHSLSNFLFTDNR